MFKKKKIVNFKNFEMNLFLKIKYYGFLFDKFELITNFENVTFKILNTLFN